MEILGPTSISNDSISLQYAFDPEEKVTDFLRGLVQKFNLVIEPVRNERNVIRIEPFNDWVDLGTQKDWTDKVDRSVKFSIRHPLSDQPRSLVFTDLEDDDAINQYHLSRTGNIYGQQNYISESDIAEGKQTIGSYFAATPCKGIPSTTVGQTEMIVPFLYEQEPGEYGKPYKFKPRILHTTGLKDVKGLSPVSQSLPVAGPLFYVEDESLDPQPVSQYVSLNPLEDIAADLNTTRDLHFGNLFNPGHYNYHQPVYNGRAKRSAFSEYWAFYINELYDVDSRVLTCNVFLDPTELQDIQLNDKIFIDGHYYRINKINGYNLTREDSVEVELLKTLPRKLKFPRRRVFDFTGGDPVDITLDEDSISRTGFVGYTNYDTGTSYTGSGITTAGYKDGVQTYGTSSVWNILKPKEYLDGTNVNFGNNKLDDGAVGVNVQGRNNQVRSLENTFVQGNDNTINGGSNLNIQGNSNVVEVNTSKIAAFNSDQTNVSQQSNNVTIINGLQTSITASDRVFVAGDVLSSVDNKDAVGTTNLIGTRNTTISGSLNDVTFIATENINITGGNFHTVIGKNNDISTELDLNDYRGGTVLGGTYLDNDVYLNRVGYEIDAYAGGTTFAYSGEGLFKYIYEITWDNVSGSGTHTIELPGANDAQLQPGRSILFKCDSTITGSQSVDITVVGGGAIEGGTTFTLDTPYQYVELRAGTEVRRSEWRIVRSSNQIATTIVSGSDSYINNVTFNTPSTLSFSGVNSGFSGNVDIANATVASSSFATTASYALNAANVTLQQVLDTDNEAWSDIIITGSYQRVSGSYSGTVVDNITDTYTGSSAVNHMVTLTTAEWTSISASADPNTLYIII